MPTVFELVHEVLSTSDADLKAELTLKALAKFESGEATFGDPEQAPEAPETPARPENVQILPAREMPRRGRGQSEKNRIALIHSLCHIESYAIDLCLDALLRFAHCDEKTRQVRLPNEYFEDWLRAAADEARHFCLWRDRLLELGSSYGALPGHDGLWQSATTTNDDIVARMAIVHMVHEGRGLDRAPQTMKNFKQANDVRSVESLTEIVADEVHHVRKGVKWLKYVAAQTDADPRELFDEQVRTRFQGYLYPPFNYELRDQAEFPREWYEAHTREARRQELAASSG
ncbi:MAG: hypothetical protein MHM6MM_006448 [Cercozoa sp. M6MM]